MAKSFADDLIAMGVSPGIARAFAVTNQIEPHAMTEHHAESDVRAMSNRSAVPTQVASVPGPPPGSPHSHTAPGQGESKADTPFTTPVGSTGNKQPDRTGSGGGITGPLGTPSGTVGTGGSGGATATFTPATDWRAYLTDWGFPPDVVDQLDRMAKQYGTDTQGFTSAALAYIRGTDWYHQHFPGIGAGESNGLLGNEQDYRSYVNQATQYYQRFLGRNPTSDEISQFLTRGWNSTMIGQHLEGQAYIKANKSDLIYKFGAFDSGKGPNDSDLAALGDQVGGLNNILGEQLASRLQAAQDKFTRIFQGSAATPALSLLGGGQLSERGGNTRPDVSS